MWVRLQWTKVGKVRWTSHRDAARIWERALRRAGLPVAYSTGFSPHPRVSFGLALPTGCESLCEFLEVDLADPDLDHTAVAGLPSRLTDCLPFGMTVVGAGFVAPGDPEIQNSVVASHWVMEITGVDEAVASASVRELLDRPTAVVSRQRKGNVVHDDVRPGIEALTVVGRSADGTGVMLDAVLATKPRGVRPSDALAAAFGQTSHDVHERRSLRVAQFVERDGERRELTPAAPAAAPA